MALLLFLALPFPALSNQEETILPNGSPTVFQPPYNNRPPLRNPKEIIRDRTLRMADGAVTVDLSNTFIDPDKDPLTYSVNSSNTGVVKTSVSGTTATLTPVKVGSVTITVTVEDIHHARGRGSLTFTAAVENSKPAVATALDSKTLTVAGGAEKVDVSSNFSDADGDSLSFKAKSSNTDSVTVSVSGSEVTLTPVKVGSATITVTASDAALGVDVTFTATVENSAPAVATALDSKTLTVAGGAVAVDVSSNFSDADGDSLSFKAKSSNTDSVTVSVSGSEVTLTPVKVGSATITVTASDAALSVDATFTATVGNSKPAATSLDSKTLTVAGGAEKVDVSSNFSDADGDSLSFTAKSSNTDSVTVSVSGSEVTLTPVKVGSATITVTASDAALSVNATFTATVENSKPAAASLDSKTLTVAGGAVTVDVSSNFSDADGDTLGFTAKSSNTDSVTVSVSGSEVTLTPVKVGSATITVTASDAALSVDATFTATVENSKPAVATSLDNKALTVAGGAVTVDVSSNFSDADGDTLGFTAKSSNTDSVTVSVSGSEVTLTPVKVGSATITVTASDAALSVDATFTATVENSAPAVATALDSKTLTVAGGAVTVDVSSNFSDVDGDTLSFTAKSSATGFVTVSHSGSEVTLTPVKVGSATITVTASDAALSVDATFTATVENSKPAVAASLDSKTLTVAGGAVAVDVSSNFSDADGDTLGFTAKSSNTNFVTVSYSGSEVTLTPVKVGSATITVTASDAALSVDATFTATVENSKPAVAASLDSKTLTVAGGAVTVDVSSNFSDADGDTLGFTAKSSNTNFVTVSHSGSEITLTPVKVGSATITVTASDAALSVDATFTATVENSKPAVAASLDSKTLTVAGGAVTVDVSSNFSDADGDTLGFTAKSSNTNFVTVSYSGSEVTLTPVKVGSATVTVTASDAEFSATASFTATVDNSAPEVEAQISTAALKMVEGSISMDVSSNFSDADGDSLSFRAESSATDFVTVSYSGSEVTLTPVKVGSATVTVSASDGELSAAITFTARVDNSPPSVVTPIPDVALSRAGGERIVDVSNTFSDADNDTLRFHAVTYDERYVTVSASGSEITLTPVAVGSATVSVMASDSISVMTALFTASVVNSAPIAIDTPEPVILYYHQNGGGEIRDLDLTKLFKDPDDDELNYSVESADTSTAASSMAETLAQITAKSEGATTVTLAARDPHGLSASAATSVTVYRRNRAPSAAISLDDVVLSTAVGKVSVDVSTKFTDADGDALSFSAVSSDTNYVTVSVSGSEITLIPEAVGVSTISVTASDGELTETGTFTATVKNSAPHVLEPIADVTLSKTSGDISVEVSSHFDDVDGDALRFRAVSLDPSRAAVSLSRGGHLTISAVAVGSSTIAVTASDGELTATTRFTATVVNSAPKVGAQIGNRKLSKLVGAEVVNIGSNFSDADDDVLRFSAVTSDERYVRVRVSGSEITLIPAAVGSATISVSASDGELSATATFTATVVNSAPKVEAQIGNRLLSKAGGSVTVSVSDNFSDPDGDTLRFSAVSSDERYVGVSVSGSEVTLIPAAVGSATVSVTASDGELSAETTFTAAVVNSAPKVEAQIGNRKLSKSVGAEIVNIGSNFSDPDDDTLSFSAVSSDERYVRVSVSGSEVTLIPAAVGSATISVTPSDGALSATATFTAAVVNSAPEVEAPIANVMLSNAVGAETVDMSTHFSDPDSDSLSFTAVSSDERYVRVSVSDSEMTLIPVAVGSATISVTASDGALSAETAFTAAVVNSAPKVEAQIGNRKLSKSVGAVTVNIGSNFSDADDDTLRFSAVSSDDRYVRVSASGSEITLVPVAVGSATINVTASDGELSATATFTARVENSAPVMAQPIADVTLSVAGGAIPLDVSSNFSDSDEDALAYMALSSAPAFAFVNMSGSTMTITPAAVGSTTVAVSASDGDLSATTTFTVTVQNSAPEVQAPIADVTLSVAGGAIRLDVSSNFSDSDGDALAYTGLSSAPAFAFVNMSGSTMTITPAAVGSTTVAVSASDGDLSAATTFTVTVQNSAPKVEAPIANVTLSNAVGAESVDMSTHFSDPDSDSLSFTAVSSDERYVRVSVSDSEVTLIPVAVGSATISVIASDGELSAETTFTAAVVNSAPEVAVQFGNRKLGKSVGAEIVNLGSNFSDPDDDTLRFSAVSSDDRYVRVSASGSEITLIPVAVGSATISVSASDGELSATATFTASVENSAPVMAQPIGDMTLSVAGGAIPLDVSSNFSDSDGDALAYTVVSSAPAFAVVNMSGSTITITPAAVGSTTVAVSASDGDLSAATTFTVTVQNSAPEVQAPIADAALSKSVGVVTVNIGSNFSDADDDTLRFSAVSSDERYVRVSASGSDIVLTPVAVGSTTISVTASDGALSATATFTAAVENSAPELEAPIANVTLSNAVGTQSVYVSSNFSDPDGDSLRFSAVSSDERYVRVSVSGSKVTLIPGAVGSATIGVTASDGVLSATATFTARVENSAPVMAQPIADVTLSVAGGAIPLDVSSNFSDSDGDTLAYTGLSSAPAFAFVNMSGSTMTITPAAVGSTTVAVSASDGTLSAAATFTVTVQNSAPEVGAPIADTTISNAVGAQSVRVSSNFSDPDGDSLRFSAVSSDERYVRVSVSDSEIALTPVAVGSATISVTASDGELSATATFSATVVNSAPKVKAPIADAALSKAGSAITVNIGSNFSDPDGDSLRFSAVSSDERYVRVSVSGSEVTLTPAAVGSATISVTASDGELSATATFSATVQNSAPEVEARIADATLSNAVGAETVDMSTHFSDPDGDSLSFSAVSSDERYVRVSVSGSEITLVPVAVGSTTISVTASDGALSATATFSATVVNNAPEVKAPIADAALSKSGGAVTVNIGNNFSDADGDSLSFTAKSSETDFVTVSFSGSEVTLTPVKVGSTTISVTASDGELSAETTFTAAVVNSAPEVKAPIADVMLSNAVGAETVDVSTHFSDPDSDSLAFRAVSSDARYVRVSVAGSEMTLTPAAVGSTTISVTASDGALSATATFTAAVVNSAPEIEAPIADVTLNKAIGAVTVRVSSNFSDPDGDALRFSAVSSDKRYAKVSASGSEITLVPVAVGSAIVSVTASDAKLTVSQTFSVTVKPAPNRAPVAIEPIAPVTLVDGQPSKTVKMSGNFSDPDGDELSYTAESFDASVATAIASGDEIELIPVRIGSTTVTVTASDGELTVAQSIDVTVEPTPNRPPVATGENLTVILTPENPSATLDGSDNFTDPDGDELTYTAVSADTTQARVSVSGGLATIDSVAVGSTTVILTAADSGGLSASLRVKVKIVGLNDPRYRTELLPNYPTPFNPDTWIPYRLGEAAHVTMTIYDMSGNVVKIFELGYQEAGTYETTDKALHWDGKNHMGEPVAAGIYFYNLTTDSYTKTLKTSLAK